MGLDYYLDIILAACRIIIFLASLVLVFSFLKEECNYDEKENEKEYR